MPLRPLSREEVRGLDARGAEVRLDGPTWSRLMQQIEGLGTSSDN